MTIDADARRRRPARSRRATCCCRGSRSGRASTPAGERDGELPAAADVDVESGLGDPARDLGGEERLARVVDLRAAMPMRANSRSKAARVRARARRAHPPRPSRRGGCRSARELDRADAGDAARRRRHAPRSAPDGRRRARSRLAAARARTGRADCEATETSRVSTEWWASEPGWSGPLRSMRRAARTAGQRAKWRHASGAGQLLRLAVSVGSSTTSAVDGERDLRRRHGDPGELDARGRTLRRCRP